MLQKNKQAPPKKKAQDAVEFGALEAVRNDPRVRKIIEAYRTILTSLAGIKASPGVIKGVKASEAMRRLIEFISWWEFGKEHKLDDLPGGTVHIVIKVIAKVYHEVTGKSPRTVGSGAGEVPEGKHPFSAFVIEIFKQEGLEPPPINQIRKAIKKEK